MPKLLVLLPDGVSTEYELSDEQLSIGRGSNNTIKIDDQKASRNHCSISKDGDGSYYLKDLDSRNGTKLNGAKIAARTKLKVGDVIRIGKTKFAFEKFPDKYQDDDDGPAETVAEEAEKPKYVLEVTEGKSVGGIIELKDGVTTFGRKSSNDVTIDDDKASGNHCEIRKEAMGFILVDLDSTNGTKFRAAGKSEFEKVSKVPLSVGSEIRVGAMVYKYKNIGAPNPDDEVLAEVAGGKAPTSDTKPATAGSAAAASGTPAAHTGKTVHVPRPTTSPMAMAGLGMVVAVAVLSVVAYFLLHGATVETGGADPNAGLPPKPSIEPQLTAIKNANFQTPANADGQPQNWAIGERGKQKLSQVTDPKEPPTSKNMVCEIDRVPAAGPQAVFELNSEHINEVKQGGAYSLKMRLRSTNDSEGAFGAKLQFFSPKNELVAEFPYLLTGSHDGWYQLNSKENPKEFVVKAPDQPTYAQLQLFASGNKGQVFFDDVQLWYLPAESPARLPDDVNNGLVTYKPRDFTGAFSVAINHLPALGQGRMAIIDKRGAVVSGTEFISLTDMSDKSPKAKIYNAALNEWLAYEISAQASGKGILLTITPKGSSSDSGYHLALLVDLVESYAASKVDSISDTGDVKPLAGPDDACPAGSKAQEILFSQGDLSVTMAGTKASNLIFAVSRPTNKVRTLTILCDNPVELYLAQDSETLIRTSAQMADQIGAQVRNRAWSAVTSGLSDFNNRYGARFPALSARLKGFDDQMQSAYVKDLADASALIPAGNGPIKTAVGKPIVETINKTYVSRWQGTPHAGEFEKLSTDLALRLQDAPQLDMEAIARQLREKEGLIDVTLEEAKTDDVGNKLTAILNDYAVLIKKYETTDLAKTAAEKKKQYDVDLARVIDENTLLDAVAGLLAAGQYDQATKFIEGHMTYKKYPVRSMTRLEAAMKRWAGGKP